MANNVRVLKVENAGYGYDSYFIYITAHQMMKLPKWVYRHINAYISDDNRRHVRWRIDAKDELEALMRFRKLWDALSVFHEEK